MLDYNVEWYLPIENGIYTETSLTISGFEVHRVGINSLGLSKYRSSAWLWVRYNPPCGSIIIFAYLGIRCDLVFEQWYCLE
jgi:hypothetical protein